MIKKLSLTIYWAVTWLFALIVAIIVMSMLTTPDPSGSNVVFLLQDTAILGTLLLVAAFFKLQNLKKLHKKTDPFRSAKA